MFKQLVTFVKEAREELKKVTWPDRDEVTSFTMVVIVAVVVISLFLYAIDTVLGNLITTVMN